MATETQRKTVRQVAKHRHWLGHVWLQVTSYRVAPPYRYPERQNSLMREMERYILSEWAEQKWHP